MSVIRRLPRYYRYLTELLHNGIYRISSRELATRMGLTASQIRQDLNCFGGFGQQGYGYDVENLHNEIGNILGVHSGYPAVLVGCGNLGRAVANYLKGSSNAFELTAAFDSSQEKIGTHIIDVPVLDVKLIPEYCAEHPPVAAILCVPHSAAEKVVEALYNVGLRNFLNFSHYDISMPYPDATVENVHIMDSMLTLCYRITNPSDGQEPDKE